MKLTSETKMFLGIIIGTLCVIGVAVVFLSQPPKPIEKSKLITPTTHTLGSAEAKVWLVEFSDFRCPACHAFADAVEELVTAHKDTLLLAYRYFPLPQHPYSQKAAIAAEAAGRQNKFWEMGALLFNNQDSLSDVTVASVAASLALDIPKFSADIQDPALKALIESDVAYGEQIRITATPTFFLNGVKLDVGTPDDLKQKVVEAINNTK